MKTNAPINKESPQLIYQNITLNKTQQLKTQKNSSHKRIPVITHILCRRLSVLLPCL